MVRVTNLSAIATNLTNIVMYDLMSLMLPNGLRANISVRAINSIGSSEYSDSVAFMISSCKLCGIGVDRLNAIDCRQVY